MSVTNVDVDGDDIKALEEVILRHRRRAAYQCLAERGAQGGVDRLSRDRETRKASRRGGTDT